MNANQDREAKFPEGTAYLDAHAKITDQCAKFTTEHLGEMGVKASATYRDFGTVTSLLERAGGCYWECSGGDHTIQYIAGRVCNSALSSLRLSLAGYYDESLALTRSIGEVGNLLFLFMIDRKSLQHWKNASKWERINDFGPGAVRKGFDKFKMAPLISRERYSALSELSIHVTPQTKPQAHNILGVPTVGSLFQPAGFLLSLNELGLATAISALPVPWLLSYSEARKNEFKDASSQLVSSLGKVGVLNISEMWSDLSKPAKDNSEHGS